MLAFPLFPGASGVETQSLVERPDALHIVLKTTNPTAFCPLCKSESRRIHSRYRRTVADLPWAGRSARLHLLVRRFFCSVPECVRKIFTERVPEVVAAKGRSTNRLAEGHRQIGLALGGQAGGRLASVLGMPVSGDTILRRIRGTVLPEVPPPRVVGVDDWALRRGQRYGTLLCDLERRRPIAMLRDRSAETLSAWLEEHPQVEIISRDRADEYAKGAAEGAPQATQVADRWHLLKNVQDALRRVVDRHHQQVEQAMRPSNEQKQPDLSPPAVPEADTPAANVSKISAAAASLRQVRRARRLGLYEQVIALREQGIGQREIARQTDLNRSTVRRYVSAGSFPERAISSRPQTMDRFTTYLSRRWEEGCCNAAQLYKEVKDQGFAGSYYMVRRRVAVWRDAADKAKSPRPVSRRLSSRATAWLLLKAEADLHEDESQLVERLEERCPELALAARLARAFSTMVRKRQSTPWPEWLARASGSDVPVDLRRFAEGMRADESAVTAALSLPWSNGQLEGQINRLKTLKRQMYGRASFDLLRHRFLSAA